MGQYWLTVNLTRGSYITSRGAKLAEIASDRPFLRGLIKALRPGEPWSGHRVVVSGEYDRDTKGRVATYLSAHGLAVSPEVAAALAAGRDVPKHFQLYDLYSVKDSALSATCDDEMLGFAQAAREALAEELLGGAGGAPSPFAGLRFALRLGPESNSAAAAREAAADAAEDAAPPDAVVSHDAAQKVLLRSCAARTAFLCLLAESDEGPGFSLDVPYLGAWAANRLQVLPAAEADALGYKDITDECVDALEEDYLEDDPAELKRRGIEPEDDGWSDEEEEEPEAPR